MLNALGEVFVFLGWLLKGVAILFRLMPVWPVVMLIAGVLLLVVITRWWTMPTPEAGSNVKRAVRDAGVGNDRPLAFSKRPNSDDGPDSSPSSEHDSRS